MSDGRIQIDIEIDGKPVKMVTSDLKEFESAAKKSATGPNDIKKSIKDIDGKKVKDATSDFSDLANTSKKSAKDVDGVSDAIKDVDGKPIQAPKDGMEQFGEEAKKGKKSVNDFVVALGLIKVASAVFNILKDSMSSAVERFDTLEKFPRVLESMGFEAEQSGRAMERMSNSIEGLPTTLNDMVGLTQKFVNITGDLDKSVNTAEALNNAMLASGSTSADAARGIEQYSQMLANGEPDMQSWKSVNETMGYGLKRTAEEMLGAGSTATDLYAALKSGKVTMEEVNSKIIELGGSTGELAELARKNSAGIATSFANLKNSAVKGLANVLKSLDNLSVAVTNKTIAENLDKMKGAVNKSFTAINKTIESSTPVVKGIVKVFGTLGKAADDLSPALTGVFVAYAGIRVVEQTRKIFENSASTIFEARKALEGLEKVTLTLTTAKAKELVALELSENATKQEIASKLASNGVLTIQTALIGVLTGAMTVNEFATLALAKAQTVLNGALSLIAAHPVVAVLAGLAIVIATVSKVSKSMNKQFYETNKKMRDATDSVKENSEAAKDNVRERETNIARMEEESRGSKGLVDRIDELTRAEKASTSGKKEIKENVEELNRIYPELNLMYDENTNKINSNAEAVKAQIDAMSSYDKVIAIQENMKSSTQELSEAEAEGAVIADNLKEVRKAQGENSWWATGKLIDLIKTEEELMKQEEANGKRKQTLSSEQKALLEQQAQARDESLAMQKAAIQEAGLQYDFLSDKQKETVDKMKENYQGMLEAATSFTSDLSYELDLTGQELIKFVENNQTIMAQWGENLKTLTEKGANEGFIEQLRNMGPEGAKYAQIAVNMSDEEFNKMNDLFAGAPKVSEDAWKKAFGMENIDPAVSSLVIQGKNTFAQEIASADFGALGINISQGLAGGIQDGSKDVSSAVSDVSDAAEQTIRSKNGIHSPSRLYHEIGGFIAQGLAKGVIAGDSLVKAAMSRLSLTMLREGTQMLVKTKVIANMIPNQFNGLNNQLSSVGQDAMSGLNNGLIAGSGAVMSTARSIANSIAQTMQTALKIHSPSHVMRDDVGRYIPQGIAVGIERDSKKVYSVIDNLRNGLMDRINPEIALGIQDIGSSNFAMRLSNSSNTSNSYSNSFDGFMNGATFHIREEADIDKLADKLMSNKEEAQTARGQRRTIRP